MKLDTCTGRDCPCERQGDVRKPLRPIENEVFGHLRAPLEGGSRRFHFVLLDGYRGYAASMGRPIETAGGGTKDESIAEDITELTTRLSAGEGCLTLHAVAARLVESETAPGMARLRRWAAQYLGDLGQPLTENPSRVEQCLAIRAAQQHSEIALDGRLWPRDGSPSGPFKIDDYLADAGLLSSAWITAATMLGAGSPNQGLRPPLTADTAPFLVAEYLQFAREAESGATFISRIAATPPGMAVLPLRILAQYRAAAVWFYEGPLDDECHDSLRTHINKMGADPSEWIEPLIEMAFTNASSLALLDTLAQHGFDPGTSTLLHCRRVQQTLSDIWFSSRLKVPGANDQELRLPSDDNEGGRSQLLGTTETTMHLDATEDPDVANLLGFGALQLTAPLLDPRPDERRRASERASTMLSRVSKSAHTALERAAAQRRLTVSVAGHEVANSLDEIMTFASDAGWRDGALTPVQRLDVIKSMAEYQSASIWVMRALARGTLDVLVERLPVASRAPTPEELEFWRSYLLGRLEYALYARWWSVRPDRRKDRPVRMVLRYAFEAVDRKDGSVLAPRFERDIIIDQSFVPGRLEDPVRLRNPLWPLNQDVRGAQDKLGEYGRLSLLLWGGVELVRNAGQATAKRIQVVPHADEEAITVVAQISADSHKDWRLRVEVKNPSFFDSNPLDVPALRRIHDVLGQNRCRFLQLGGQESETHYAFELDLFSKEAGR